MLPDGFCRARTPEGSADPTQEELDGSQNVKNHETTVSNQPQTENRRPIILLDIDGVLNPSLCPNSGGERPLLRLPNDKRALVRRLARCGRIAWVSTWPADIVAGLESQLDLKSPPLRVTMVFRPADADVPTPKLASVTRWLERMNAAGEADWNSVVWVDDVLGDDAQTWAKDHRQPVHLEKPEPDLGLTEVHVARIEAFVAPA